MIYRTPFVEGTCIRILQPQATVVSVRFFVNNVSEAVMLATSPTNSCVPCSFLSFSGGRVMSHIGKEIEFLILFFFLYLIFLFDRYVFDRTKHEEVLSG